MLVSDFAALYEHRGALHRQYGYSLVLFDATRHGGVPAESRRYLATLNLKTPLRGSVVVFGASLLIRAAVSLILGAARQFGREQPTKLLFAANEAACWELIDAERQLLIPSSARSH